MATKKPATKKRTPKKKPKTTMKTLTIFSKVGDLIEAGRSCPMKMCAEGRLWLESLSSVCNLEEVWGLCFSPWWMAWLLDQLYVARTGEEGQVLYATESALSNLLQEPMNPDDAVDSDLNMAEMIRTIVPDPIAWVEAIAGTEKAEVEGIDVAEIQSALATLDEALLELTDAVTGAVGELQSEIEKAIE
jgi:hypothetical protein